MGVMLSYVLRARPFTSTIVPSTGSPIKHLRQHALFRRPMGKDNQFSVCLTPHLDLLRKGGHAGWTRRVVLQSLACPRHPARGDELFAASQR